MSSNPPNENLVAYLDGELPDDEVSAVEKSLVEDASIRRDVEQLTRTYDLLDLLPDSRASDGFAEKTLTAIRTGEQQSGSERVDDHERSGSQKDWGRRAIEWSIRVVAFCGLMLAAAVGFNSSFRQNSEPIDALLTELPLIQRLDEYQEIGDVQFLKVLSESRLFDEQNDAPQQ